MMAGQNSVHMLILGEAVHHRMHPHWVSCQGSVPHVCQLCTSRAEPTANGTCRMVLFWLLHAGTGRNLPASVISYDFCCITKCLCLSHELCLSAPHVKRHS